MTDPTPTSGRPDPIRLVLVDDHRMFRSGVRAELDEISGNRLDIVGEAGTVDQAVAVGLTRTPAA